MILITKCYRIITPESAEEGDISDSGFEWEDVPYTFKEMIDTIKRDGFTQCSCYPSRGDIFEWLSTGFSVDDYRTGEEIEYTLHYSRKNPAKNDKYWKLAVRFSQERN